MKFVKAALASAVLAALSGSAFAQATVVNTTDLTNDVTVFGGALVAGVIPVGSEAAAVTSNEQASQGNVVITLGGGNDTSLTDAANDATGNVAINVASGTGNAQSNDAAVVAMEDATNVFASAQSFSTQISAVNANISLLSDNRASLTDAVNGAQGNIGLNMASGSGNMQSNQMAAAAHTEEGDGTIATASSTNEQLVTLTLNGDAGFTLTNGVTIAGSLNGAQGNIGANIAAGYGNLQHNSLAIASTD